MLKHSPRVEVSPSGCVHITPSPSTRRHRARRSHTPHEQHRESIAMRKVEGKGETEFLERGTGVVLCVLCVG